MSSASDLIFSPTSTPLLLFLPQANQKNCCTWNRPDALPALLQPKITISYGMRNAVLKVHEQHQAVSTTLSWSQDPAEREVGAGVLLLQELPAWLMPGPASSISLARLLCNSWQLWCVHRHKEGLVFLKLPQLRRFLAATSIFVDVTDLTHCLKTWQWSQAAVVMGWETARTNTQKR